MPIFVEVRWIGASNMRVVSSKIAKHFLVIRQFSVKQVANLQREISVGRAALEFIKLMVGFLVGFVGL